MLTAVISQFGCLVQYFCLFSFFAIHFAAFIFLYGNGTKSMILQKCNKGTEENGENGNCSKDQKVNCLVYSTDISGENRKIAT